MNNIIKTLIFSSFFVMASSLLSSSEKGQSKAQVVSYNHLLHFADVIRICRENCQKLNDCNDYEQGDLRACPGFKEDLKYLDNEPTNRVWVTEKDKEVTGFIQHRVFLSEHKILLLAVDEQYRQQGQGLQLLAHVENEIIKQGGSSVSLGTTSDNYSAQSFYHNQGYYPNDYSTLTKRL